MQIHKTAVVSRKAKLADDISVGPYTIICDDVQIGAGTNIGAHCFIEGHTKIGSSCEIFSGAVVGSRPQDLKFKDEITYLEIGSNNIIREYCTFNPGTGEGGKTIVGSGNLFMAYSHIAHDCKIGDNCVFANNATLAGHVTVEDKTVIGGLVAVHQFVHLGTLCIIGGCSKVVQDIPPYSTCDGHPTRVYGLNLVGLRRNNISRDSIHALTHAFNVLFSSGLSIRHALESLVKEASACPEVAYLIDFIKRSERGISRSCRVIKE
ncbi:MAG: acyl-ACP--UDP-N-acetylglucosamine O-acyltransferase [Candidatus Omnitrophica bacterium]|nr:acyl-ACP--UDP-N-acetylglucosamine O-acyltransferase [Candidatus Omnitrophota bacterium]